jgi:hypothetical protein
MAMAKTNYTKVEEALAEGLRKISVNQFLAAAPSTKQSHSIGQQELSAKRSRLLRSLHTELNYLQKQGHQVYEKYQIKKSWINKLIETPNEITTEEWDKIVKLKAQLVAFKKGLENKSPEEINENLVKEQTKKNLTKRFNVNEKWLPLK